MAKGALIPAPALFEQRRQIELHHDEAHEHQRRADVALDAEPLVQEKERKDRRKDRLEREDQARVARGGELLLDALNDEADAGAENAEKQRRRPDHRCGREPRRLQQQRKREHHNADDDQLAHTEGDGVDLLPGDSLLCQHQIDGVKRRHQQADDVAQRRLERFVQRQQRDADKAQQQREGKLLPRPFAVKQKFKKRREEHGHRADEARVRDRGIQHAVGRADIDHHERKPDEQAVFERFAAGVRDALAEGDAEHEKRRQKAEGVERERLHIAQADRRQAVGNAPKSGGEHQHHIRFSLSLHRVSLQITGTGAGSARGRQYDISIFLAAAQAPRSRKKRSPKDSVFSYPIIFSAALPCRNASRAFPRPRRRWA